MSAPSKQQARHVTGPLALPEHISGSLVDNKYRLIRKLGQGGMGSVWAAHSLPLDVSVALKLLRVDTAHADSAERLVREARVMARLADPGIVRVFDVGQTGRGEPYIAMELLTGATLRQILDGGRLDGVRAVRILLPIVRALESAHRAGVVHRDVKPDNIVLAQGARGDLQPKLLDFGAAKVAQAVDHLTRVGTVVGSPLYMSPEQARGERVDHRTDLWSVCVVLYEAVTGKPPFWGDNTNALLHAISTQEVRALPEGTAFDPALWAIVRRGLTNSRDGRWQTARDLMLELAAWLRTQGTSEDITGTALQGRGLGRFSSLPRFAAVGAESSTKARARVTAVVGASTSEGTLAAGASSPEPASRLWSLARVLPSFARSPRFWSIVASVLLVSLLAGIWLRRTSSPPPVQNAPAITAPARVASEALPAPAPRSPAATAASATPAGEALKPEAPAASAAAAAEPSAAPAPPPSRSGGARKAKAPAPSKTLAPPRAPRPAFKNPFD